MVWRYKDKAVSTFTYLLLSHGHPTGSKTRIQPFRYQAPLELHREGVWERSLLSSRACWAMGKKTARITVLLGQFEATDLMIEGLFAYKIEIFKTLTITVFLGSPNTVFLTPRLLCISILSFSVLLLLFYRSVSCSLRTPSASSRTNAILPVPGDLHTASASSHCLVLCISLRAWNLMNSPLRPPRTWVLVNRAVFQLCTDYILEHGY